VGIDVINEDFFKWMELELSDASVAREAPAFVSVAAGNLFKAISRTLEDHELALHVICMGPFFDRSKISSYFEIAARNTGISLELLKRFRDAYPEELRYGMRDYFDIYDIGVCD
jgi:hypothetical protein